MQTVCCHSKLTASVSLANHVPLVKRALEVFVYRFSIENLCLGLYRYTAERRDVLGCTSPTTKRFPEA